MITEARLCPFRHLQFIRLTEPDASVVEDGFTVSERSVADAEEDVQAWLSGLGY